MKSFNIGQHFIRLQTNTEVPSKETVGNKGVNLATMMDYGIRVPLTVVVTVEGSQFIAENGIKAIDLFPLQQKCVSVFGEDVKVSVRSSGVVSMAGMLDTVHGVDIDSPSFGQAIANVVNSWDNPKAKLYRKVKDLDDTPQIAVVIQPTIKAYEGGSGIMFSRNPNTGDDEMVCEFLPNEMGDALAEGRKGGVGLDKLSKEIQDELIETAQKLEGEFKEVQDIEFVHDGRKLYFVQCRSAKLTTVARVKTLVDFHTEGLIFNFEFMERFDEGWLKDCYTSVVEEGAVELASGLGAVGGTVTGTIVKDDKEAALYDSTILVAELTTTDDLRKIVAVDGLITAKGGMTSHPAITCREMEKPCVTNLGDITQFETGMVVTIDGDIGKVFDGDVVITQHNYLAEAVEEIFTT